METKEAHHKICYTTEYGAFSFIKGNRDINEAKIKKIVSSFKSGIDLFKFCPILVNEKLKIIDGQHRLLAAKQLGVPIYYIITGDFSLYQIATINSSTSTWKVNDYINCYTDLGNEHYKRLREFSLKYHIAISASIPLLYYGKFHSPGGVGNNTSQIFKEGLFEIRHWDRACRFGDMLLDYKPMADGNYRNRPFQKSIFKLFESATYNHGKVIEKLTITEASIDRKYSDKEYIYHIEELFNKGNHKRQTIW